jgi:hypothetical protein
MSTYDIWLSELPEAVREKFLWAKELDIDVVMDHITKCYGFSPS